MHTLYFILSSYPCLWATTPSSWVGGCGTFQWGCGLSAQAYSSLHMEPTLPRQLWRYQGKLLVSIQSTLEISFGVLHIVCQHCICYSLVLCRSHSSYWSLTVCNSKGKFYHSQWHSCQVDELKHCWLTTNVQILRNVSRILYQQNCLRSIMWLAP